MKHYFFLLLTAALLFSCGKSVDKNTLEGRAASFISLQEGVFMAVSMDLKNIIEKSGIKEGAIPEQYLSTISPYLDALYQSINLDKQVFMMPIMNTTNPDNSDFVFMFEVGDLNRLKKEIKEFGINLKKKGDLEYGVKLDAAFGVFKGETAFFIFGDGNRTDEKQIIEIGSNLSKGETIDGVVDFVTTKSDMVAFYTGDKMSNFDLGQMAPELKGMGEKMNKLYAGTYWTAKVDFKDQDALMEVNFNMGKNLKKYGPFMNASLSEDAQSVLVSDKTMFAYAMNINMEKIMSMIIEQLDDKTKDEINKQLAMLGGTEKFKQLLTGEFAMSMLADENPIFTSFIGIGDKKQVQSLMDGFGFFLGLKKNGDTYDMDGAQLMFTENGLLYAPNAELLTKMKAKKSVKLRNMNGFKFGDSPMSMFMDFKLLLQMKDIEDYAEVIQAFDFMYFQMNEKGGNGLIRSTKSNQNILRTLVESVIEMQRLDEIRQAEMDAEFEEMYGSWEEEEWDDSDLDNFDF
jgi:hypothetical protein